MKNQKPKQPVANKGLSWAIEVKERKPQDRTAGKSHKSSSSSPQSQRSSGSKP